MEVKNELVFELKRQDKEGESERVYKFTIPVNAPLGECFTAVCSFKDKVVNLINEHSDKEKEAQEPKELEEEISEE